jgi:hypothetical protein
VTALTAAGGANRYLVARMEWMLLVADDIDDFVGSLRHCLLGVRRELATILLIVASVLLLVAVSVVGSTGI